MLQREGSISRGKKCAVKMETENVPTFFRKVIMTEWNDVVYVRHYTTNVNERPRQ